jgi:hypothetical protein
MLTIAVIGLVSIVLAVVSYVVSAAFQEDRK